MTNHYDIVKLVADCQNGNLNSYSWEGYSTEMAWHAAHTSNTEELTRLHELWINKMGDRQYSIGRLVDAGSA